MIRDDFDFEPVRGLPELLPAGEQMLWQGAPDFKTLAIKAFHVRKVAVYFLLLLAWSFMSAWHDSQLARALISSMWLVPLGIAAAGILTLLAWFVSQTTVYTITSQRIVMRYGIALPVTLNLPFRRVQSAALKTNGNGSGDIPLALVAGDQISWLILWPHVRPFGFVKAEPMLRALADAGNVATILSGALAVANGGRAPVAIAPRTTMQPSRPLDTPAAGMAEAPA